LLSDPVVEGLRRSLEHRLARTERRLVAAVKAKEAEVMRRLSAARGSLFPHGVRQERKLAYIPSWRATDRVWWSSCSTRRGTHARLVSPGTRPMSANAVGRRPLDDERAPAADEPTPIDTSPRPARSRAGAFFVSLGIFTNKIFGVVRQSFIATYLGAAPPPMPSTRRSASRTCCRICSVKARLSAAFIPVYVGCARAGRRRGSGACRRSSVRDSRAGRVGPRLLGVLFTPQILPLIVGGFKGSAASSAITYVRILFPGAGSVRAWRLVPRRPEQPSKFLLSYMAPVLWNVTMIIALVWYGPRENSSSLARITAWASVDRRGGAVPRPAAVRARARAAATHRARLATAECANGAQELRSRSA
jgi:hypothetical protein